jgi:hypothetical protein
MKDFQMDNPSEGFTGRVMQNIQLDSSLTVIKSSPLIGKTAWIAIAAGFALLLTVFIVTGDAESTSEAGWMAKYLSTIKLPEIHFSLDRFIDLSKLNNPTLLWIFIGIGGLILLLLFERLLESFRYRFFSIF